MLLVAAVLRRGLLQDLCDNSDEQDGGEMGDLVLSQDVKYGLDFPIES